MAYPTLVKRVIDLEKRVQEPADAAIKLVPGAKIGGVLFDGTQDITLPGVDTPSNQDTTGTASAWTTARTLSLVGDVTGSTTIRGDADMTMNTIVTGTKGAPMPSSSNWFVVNESVNGSYRLPAGGMWAYFITTDGTGSSAGYMGTYAGVAPGGTAIFNGTPDGTRTGGFLWLVG